MSRSETARILDVAYKNADLMPLPPDDPALTSLRDKIRELDRQVAAFSRSQDIQDSTVELLDKYGVRMPRRDVVHWRVGCQWRRASGWPVLWFDCCRQVRPRVADAARGSSDG